MKTLLLWDIDGTLINSGGAGMRALRKGLHRGFGVDRSLDDIDFGGRTDRWIMRQIFVKLDLPATEENFARLFESYASELPGELANPQAHVLPGIRELLKLSGAHADVLQGLLTGNIRRTAEVKLAHHGLWAHFPFGAFADDAELRNDLGPHAIRRAKDHSGWDFPPHRIWIIGDTPHDIACGKAIGARTLAVATGHSSKESLAAGRPDALMENLTDGAAFMRLIVA